MAGEYKATCGCKIHVAQWTAKHKAVSQESCPLHKNAAALLEACNEVIKQWGGGPSHLPVSERNRLLVKMCEAANKAEGREL